MTSRPILDARRVNSLFAWDHVERSAFRLLSPLNHARVGVGVGIQANFALYEADATSYFPAFRWAWSLARAHAFRVGGRRMAHAVPAQGASVMPLIAQTVSAYIADAPVVDAPAAAWVRSRVSIVYDNFLLSGEVEELRHRVEDFEARAAAHGVRLKPQHPVQGLLTSCGLEFNTLRRTWSLKRSWSEKCINLLRTTDKAEVRLGLAVWAMRALGLPVAAVAPLSPGRTASEAYLNALARLITARPQRKVKNFKISAVSAKDATPVAVDASVHGAGVIIDCNAFSRAWERRREAIEQQQAEWEAALLALRWSAERGLEKILLMTDNLGVLHALRSGAPGTVRRCRELCELAQLKAIPELWLAYVPSASMPADSLSRDIPQQPGATEQREDVHLDEIAATWGRGAVEAEWCAVTVGDDNDEEVNNFLIAAQASLASEAGDTLQADWAPFARERT